MSRTIISISACLLLIATLAPMKSVWAQAEKPQNSPENSPAEPMSSAAGGSIGMSGGFDPHEKWINEAVSAASNVAALSVDKAFGDNVNTYNGALSFRNTDISLPGNFEIPVQLTRTLVVDDRFRANGTHIGGFAEWDIDVPRLSAIVSTGAGWRPASGTVSQRCSLPDEPPFASGMAPEEYWDGYTLSVDGSSQTLLANPSPTLTLPPGGPYKWITKDFWLISCKSTTANGYSGESFIATSPRGLKYTLDWGISKAHAPMNSPTSVIPLARQVVHFLATKIEDRFGNWVTFQYSGSQLISVTSSDGRQITISWTSGQISSATTNSRTWSYIYSGSRLSQVQLPDGSTWQYTATGALAVYPAVWSPMYEDPYGCPQSIEPSIGTYGITVRAPSGASATFSTEVLDHVRTQAPQLCVLPTPSYWYRRVPDFTTNLTLMSKQVAGPGLPIVTWNYSYANDAPLFPPDTAKTTIALSTSGEYTEYTYGIAFDLNEGQLLGIAKGGSASTILDRVTNTYVSNAEAASQAFPVSLGDSLPSYVNRVSTQWLRPLKKREEVLQGRKFVWQVEGPCNTYSLCFDTYAQPTKVVKSSSP